MTSVTDACRLCGGRTRTLWRQMVLGKFDVAYAECESCGSLQTDTPYWLDEAYDGTGTGFDTGACQRSIDCALNMSAILELLGFPRDRDCLDYGAGLGLYARMMRDRGWRYFAHEKYVVPFYMDRFVTEPDGRQWGLISAFEVFEHLPQPGATLDLILGTSADYVFFSTELWEGQGRDWHYLSPLQGHHVFFHSSRGLGLAGQKHGYEFHDLGFFKCFARPGAREKIAYMMRNIGNHVLQSFVNHQRNPYQYAAIDNAALLAGGARK